MFAPFYFLTLPPLLFWAYESFHNCRLPVYACSRPIVFDLEAEGFNTVLFVGTDAGEESLNKIIKL